MYDRYMPYLLKNKTMGLMSSRLNSIESPQVGYLKLNVFRYDLRTPIAGAFVRVSKLTISGYYRETGRGIFIADSLSDENGSVPIIELPVLTNQNEMYNVTINYSDFCPAIIFNVPIYSGITTAYDVYLHHYTMDDSDMHYHFILQPRIPGHDTEPEIF